MQKPEKLSWGREPFPDSLRSSGSSPEAQALVLPGGKDRPELCTFAEGALLHKASQAKGSAFIGEERQEDQVWDGRLMTFVASTGDPDRNGNILDPQGWDLRNYLRNPVVLFAHNWNLPPVGKAVSIGIEGQVLKATVQFAPTQLGQELALLNADHYLRAISVGARPLEWEVRRHLEHGYPIGIHSHKQELVELSIVNVPANPAALQAAAHPSTVGALLAAPAAPALITTIMVTEKHLPLYEVPACLDRIFAELRRAPW